MDVVDVVFTFVVGVVAVLFVVAVMFARAVLFARDDVRTVCDNPLTRAS